jgi:hypothetical protein
MKNVRQEHIRMNNFEDNVIKWASDRNILKGSDLKAQSGKLLEEVLEMYCTINGVFDKKPFIEHVVKHIEDHLQQFSPNNIVDRFQLADDIGDTDVVIQIICAMASLSRSNCQKQAWNEIKNRKGKLIDGKFVKET